MNRNYRPTSSGWAIILLSAAALALGGCGRKGGLDLPPNASPSVGRGRAGYRGRAARRSPACSIRTYGTDAPPAAAKGSKKSFILDPLLQ